MDNFLSIVLFNTKKHTYTIGDMITLTSGMVLLCGVVFVSLIVGIKQWRLILLILMTDIQGNEHLDVVNNIKYNDKLSCLVDKSIMSNDSIIASDDHTTKSITYFCADSLLYMIK